MVGFFEKKVLDCYLLFFKNLKVKLILLYYYNLFLYEKNNFSMEII